MEDSVYRFGEFSISPAERRLTRAGQAIALPPKAFDTLYLLVRRHGSLVSHDAMTHAIWPETHVSPANLTNIIVQLRKVLGRDAIHTVSKSGYRFTLAVLGEPGVKQAVYGAFVRGKELLQVRSLTSISTARDLFLFCVAEDPHFATGWAWLGRACRVLEKFKGEASSCPSPAEAAFRRAFLLDPDLACAHQFYTQLQVDSGKSVAAMARLAGRLKRLGGDPETFAGLVHVFRCCGLLQQSVAAHDRAITLDPALRTSVTHTHFLLGDYAGCLETYVGKPYYLDAAAWAALGEPERAAKLLRPRVAWADLGPMRGLIASLLAVLEAKPEEAFAIMEQNEIPHEPEGLFYFARHYAMANAEARALNMIERARLAGFWSSYALKHDAAFARMRSDSGFAKEIAYAEGLEAEASRIFFKELGGALFP